MASALALAVCLGQIQESPRQRVELENNIRVHVERLETPDRLSIQLTALLGGIDEDAEREMTLAHLAEHLSAKGANRDLDIRLEQAGMYLTAQTSREAVTFRIDCRPEQYIAALDAIREVIEPREITEEELAKERRIIAEEFVVTRWSDLQSSAAWKQILKLPGHTSFYSQEVLDEVTPENFAEFQSKLFAGQRMSLVVVGGLAPKPVLDRVKSTFESRPRGPFSSVEDRSSTLELRVWGRSGLDGGVVSVGVDQVDSLDTLSVIGAGMALGMRMSGSELIMSPSARASVVTLANPNTEGVQGLPDLVRYEGPTLAHIGLRAVQRWVNDVTTEPSLFVQIQGPCTARNLNLTMEKLSQTSERLTPGAIQQAMQLFAEGARL